MAETQTNIDFKIIETDDQTKVLFDKGQYIIEDGSKVYYDPTNGTGIVDRIEIGSADIEELRHELTGVFHYKGSTDTLPTTNNQIGDVWNLSSNIAVGELTVTTITTTPFTLPAARIDYIAEEELDGNDEPTGYYYHLLYISVNKESVNVLPDDKEWYVIESEMSEDLKVVISGFSPLYYGGTVQGLTIGIEQEDIGEEIIFTAAILDRTTIPLITEWQELASSGGQVELVSIPYHNIVKFNKGDNLAWAEPGYWDTLSNTVDLTYYVKNTDYAGNSKGGVIKVWNNSQYGLYMSSGYLRVSPATSEEIAAKTHGYKPIVPARIEDAVKAGTHQDMSDSYNFGTKGGLPASYTAVKNYINTTINKKVTGAYKIMGSIDTSELEIDCDLPSIGASKGDVYNIKSGTLNSYYLTDYTTAAGEVLHTSTLSTTSTTFTRRYPYGLLTLIPYLEHSSSVYLYAGGYDGGNWDSDKVVTAEFDSYDYDEDTEVLTITFKNLSKTFEPTSLGVYVVSVCDIFFNLKLTTGDNVVWTSYGWDKLASDVDLSAYATTAYVDSLVGGLEDEIDSILTEGV